MQFNLVYRLQVHAMADQSSEFFKLIIVDRGNRLHGLSVAGPVVFHRVSNFELLSSHNELNYLARFFGHWVKINDRLTDLLCIELN